MFMFRNSVEVKKLEKEIESLNFRLRISADDLEFEKRMASLKTEEALNALKKEMQEKLVKSDLQRNEAIAKLEIYEKMNTKEDANFIRTTLTDLVKMVATIGKHEKSEINIVK